MVQVENVFKAIRIPEPLLIEIRAYLKKLHEAKGDYHEQAIKTMRKEYDDSQCKLDRLVDLLIEQSITQSVYDKKVYDLRNRQHEIEHRLSGHTKADETFHYTLSSLV